MEREYSTKYLQLNRDKRIVFDARELPFFRVKPDLSDLGQNSRVEQELTERYPKLLFNLACVVDGAVLINDLLAFTPLFDFSTGNTIFNMARELNTTSAITLQVVDGALANDFLLSTLATPAFKMGPKPLIVFPGEGARIVSEYMRRQEPGIYDLFDMENAVYLNCKRTMRRKGVFDIAVDPSALPENFRGGNVLIIDDVIASGQTIQAVAGKVREKYGKINIAAATWFFVEPSIKQNKESPSGIEGIDLTIASFALRGNYMRRPPINSLSCFIREGENPNYSEVKAGFIEKYIEDKNKFQRILVEMKP